MTESSEQPKSASTELLRAKHPRVNGVISLILAIILVAGAGVGFWLSATAVAVLGPAVALLLLAVLSILLAIRAFRLASVPSVAQSLLLPLRLLAILAVLVGVAGIALAYTFGGITGSTPVIVFGAAVLVLAIIVAAQAALVYGAATERL